MNARLLTAATRLTAALLLGALASAVSAQEHPNTARGLGSAGGYDALGLDTIAAFNGALTVSIPMASYPVNGSLAYGFGLVYTSQAWEHEDYLLPSGATATRGVPSKQHNAGLGWALSFGRYNPPRAFTDFDNNRRTYVSPDGSGHAFYSSLHQGEPQNAGFEYTRDSSYLRLSGWNAEHDAVIELPDGMQHTFDRTYPTLISDRFGNEVRISYCAARSNCNGIADPKTVNFWRVKDTHNRTHWIELQDTGLAHQPKVLTRIELQAWNGQLATYTFRYNQSAKGGAQGGAPAMIGCGGSQSINVWLLTQIDLPDGSSYSMPVSSYGTGTTPCTRGLLQQLELPTLGKLAWQYGTYRFPDASTTRLPWRTTAGVVQRSMIPAGGTALTPTVYTSSLPLGADNKPTGELVNTVTEPSGTKTTRYFTVCSGSACTPDQSIEYGLPFSRLQAGSSGRFLSTHVQAAGSTSLRMTYVLYERDPTAPPAPVFADYQRLDQRLLSASTTYIDDSSKVASAAYSNFDGLGHYRRVDLSGTIGAGDAKTTFTDFNPGRGTLPGSFTMLSTGERWLLGLHGRQSVTEGSKSFHRQACFDPATGFLLGVRTLASTAAVADSTQVGPLGAKDLLWVATPSSTAGTLGNIGREDFYGGDNAGSLPTGSAAPCSSGSVSATYAMRHTYASGALATSRYLDQLGSDLPFLVVNRTIDPFTGLTNQSADVSGLVTRFEYDNSSRIVLAEPQASSPSLEDGWTRYIYSLASGSTEATAARVEIQHKDVNDGAVLARQVQRFDSFGRPWLDERLMRDGSTSQRETLYDAQNRVSSVSALGNRSKRTTYAYEPLGRIASVTTPDGQIAGVDYTGIRLIRRTVRVGTSWTGSAVDTSAQTTREFYDRQGRLSAIEEHSAPSPTAWVRTNYGYDATNRLTSAVTDAQSRSFVFDGRGFLVAENHPEKLVPGGSSSDVEHRRYDARGNVLRTVDGEHDLGFDYDRAERLLRVYDWATNTPLKELAYGVSNSGSNYRLGKLQSATRHNRFSLCGIDHNAAITETYTYAGRMGRVSQRDTQLNFDGAAGEAFTQTFAWTALGRTGSVGYPQCTFCTAPSPRTTTSTYSNGWLTAVTETPSGVPFATNVTYHANGLVNTITHANNVLSVQENDTNFMARPRRLYAKPSGGGAGSELWDSGIYQYDGVSNVTRSGNGHYVYDPISRLKEAQIYLGAQGGNPSVSSTTNYDQYGNILSFGGTSGRSTPTDPATNRLCGAACGGTASYSTCGALTGWNGQTYEHDPFGMQLRTTIGAEDWLHFYTADDERVWSYRVGSTPSNRWTLRDLGGTLLREYASDNAGWRVVEDYIYREGQLLAAVTASGTKHFHLDHLGTPRAITRANGTLEAYHAYYPFGEEATAATQDAERRKLTGHERDLNGLGGATPQGDDLDYMHARFYNPLTARFLSVDPIGGWPSAPQSWNRYGYVLGSPLKFTDPFGLCPTVDGITPDDCVTVTTTPPRVGGITIGLPPGPAVDLGPTVNDVVDRLSELGNRFKDLRDRARPLCQPFSSGYSMDVSAIIPFVYGQRPGGGTGGGTGGANLQYLPGKGVGLYAYGTPSSASSTGIDIGVALTGNIAFGSGPWAGLFDTVTGTPWINFTGGAFTSELNEVAASGEGWAGVQVGVGYGLPGGAKTTTNYRQILDLSMLHPWCR